MYRIQWYDDTLKRWVYTSFKGKNMIKAKQEFIDKVIIDYPMTPKRLLSIIEWKKKIVMDYNPNRGLIVYED